MLVLKLEHFPGCADEAEDVRGDGPADIMLRFLQQRADLRLRGELRLVQGPRILQPAEEEPDLPAGLLRRSQAEDQDELSLRMTHQHLDIKIEDYFCNVSCSLRPRLCIEHAL